MRAFLCLLLGVAWASASVLIPGDGGHEENIVESAKSPLEECLRKDSISCIQMQIFRMAKDFFDRPTVDVIGGMTLHKVPQFENEMRSLASDGNRAERMIAQSQSLEEKEGILEGYVADEARNFFEKRNIKWNLGEIAKSIVNATPENVKSTIKDLIEEGRGRRRKVLRVLMPFLLGLKVKFATVLGLTFLGAILLAKKALLLSVISIAISVFLLVKKMFSHQHEEVYPLGHGGWHSHSDAGHVEYASHSSPVAHNLAYGGHKSS